jgi:hypothetical protein
MFITMFQKPLVGPYSVPVQSNLHLYKPALTSLRLIFISSYLYQGLISVPLRVSTLCGLENGYQHNTSTCKAEDGSSVLVPTYTGDHNRNLQYNENLKLHVSHPRRLPPLPPQKNHALNIAMKRLRDPASYLRSLRLNSWHRGQLS